MLFKDRERISSTVGSNGLLGWRGSIGVGCLLLWWWSSIRILGRWWCSISTILSLLWATVRRNCLLWRLLLRRVHAETVTLPPGKSRAVSLPVIRIDWSY